MAFRNCFDVLVDIGEGAEEQASRSRSRSEKEQGPGETYKFGETPDEPIELSRPLVWIDLEMTGLDLTNDVILQVRSRRRTSASRVGGHSAMGGGPLRMHT
jgi:hypothetical protein